MPRPPEEIQQINRRADYFEASFRARLVAAMRELRGYVNPAKIEAAMRAKKLWTQILPQEEVERVLLKHLGPVLTKAFMQGGKMGQVHIRKL